MSYAIPPHDPVPPRHRYTNHKGPVRAVAWSPDGWRIASGSDDATVRVWDASNGKDLYTYRGHVKEVHTVDWSADRLRIASASDDQTVRVWEWERGMKNRQWVIPLTTWVNGVAFSPDGSHVVFACDDPVPDAQRVLLHSMEYGRQRGTATPEDRTVQIWEGAGWSRKPQMTYHGHAGAVCSVAWSPDGDFIASGGGGTDRSVRVWEAATGQTLYTFRGHTGDVWSLDWSPDGSRLVSGSLDGSVRIWDATMGAELPLYTYGGHTGAVLTVAWSPDGKLIASGGHDGTVQLWNPFTGIPFATYRGHRGWVHAAAWSPDSAKIASGGSDATVQVWEVPQVIDVMFP